MSTKCIDRDFFFVIIISQEIRIKHLNILANPAKAGDANG